jgi:spore coat polysaccharide biosynthesis protein SpsF
VITRTAKGATIDDVIVATTTKKDDDAIADVAIGLKAKVYRGSENDVLDRYYRAAERYGARHIVRITADCPLIDPRVIDLVVRTYFSSGADYCANILEETFPDGEDVEVFGFGALRKAWENASLASEREHVTPYIRKRQGEFGLVSVKNDPDLSERRWTLDREEDLVFIRSVLERLYPTKPDFSMKDVLDLLKREPALEAVNSGITRNEGYIKSLEEDRLVNRGDTEGEHE